MSEHLGPLNNLESITEGSTGSESDELETGSVESDSTSKSGQSLLNLNSRATQQVDSVIDPAPIRTVGKRKRGRPSKEVIEPTGDIIKTLLAESSLNFRPYSSSSGCRKPKEAYLPHQLVLFAGTCKAFVTSQRPQHWPGTVNQRALGYGQISTLGQSCFRTLPSQIGLLSLRRDGLHPTYSSKARNAPCYTRKLCFPVGQD